MRIGRGLILALLLSVASVAIAEEKPLVKIGAILPLTGGLAPIGKDMQLGLELGAEDTKNIAVKIIYEDDRTSNRGAALDAVKKLTSVDKVDTIYNAYVSTISALTPVLKQSKTPSILIWDSNRNVPGFGEYVVGFGYTNELAGEDMADFAFHKLGKKTAAVIALHDEWCELISKSFADHFKKLGGEVVMYEVANFDTNDFRTLLTKARALKAQALYIPLFGTGLHTAIKQVRQLKFDTAVLTADSFGDSDIKESGEAAEGVFVMQLWFENAAFKQRYEKKYGANGASGVNLGYVALAYDSVMMLDVLAERLASKGQSVNAETITKNLPGFTFDGALGRTEISADRTTNRRQTVLSVKNRKFEVVWKHD